MFQYAYQNGSYVEILDIKGSREKEKADEKLFKVSNINGFSKIYDKLMKSYLYEVDGEIKTKIQFPKDEKEELGLTQRFLVFQIFIPMESSFTLETVITDTLKNKRRLIFTTSVKEIEKNHFHVKIPIASVKKGIWLNLSFDLVSFFVLFSSSTFRSLDGFVLGGTCKLKKIITMKSGLSEFSSNDEEITVSSVENQILSKTLNFVPGIQYNNQLITFNLIQKNIPSSRDISPQRRANESTLRNTRKEEVYQLGNTTGVYGTTQRETASPLKINARRNISLNFSANRTIKETINKENTSITPNRVRETDMTCLTMKPESRVRHGIGRRFFHSPMNQVSFDKVKEQLSKSQISEDLSPNSRQFSNNKRGLIATKIQSESSNAKNTGDESKKRIMSLLLKNSNSKKFPTKNLELSELSDKTPSLNKKLNLKSQNSIQILLEVSPKVGTVPQININSVKNRNAKNPWNDSDFSLLSTKTSKFNLELMQENSIKASETETQITNKVSNLADKFEKYKNSGSQQDNNRIINTASKDYSSDTERFSTFYKSRDDHTWSNLKENESLGPTNLKDEIESIEENLEYEIASNTSGVYGSRNVLDLKNKKTDISQDLEIIFEKNAKNGGTPDLYRTFRIKNCDLTNQSSDRRISGRISKNNQSDEGRTKKVLNLLEEKVKNIVLNSRPFSPPFISNLGKTHRINQSPGRFELNIVNMAQNRENLSLAKTRRDEKE